MKTKKVTIELPEDFSIQTLWWSLICFNIDIRDGIPPEDYKRHDAELNFFKRKYKEWGK